jgi:putative aldouronate transport system substrate-binding protein
MARYEEKGFPKAPYEPFTRGEIEQSRYEEIMAPITVFFKEYQQKWVLGSEDIDATWDSYIATLKRMRMDEVIEINRKAYKEYNK